MLWETHIAMHRQELWGLNLQAWGQIAGSWEDSAPLCAPWRGSPRTATFPGARGHQQPACSACSDLACVHHGLQALNKQCHCSEFLILCTKELDPTWFFFCCWYLLKHYEPKIDPHLWGWTSQTKVQRQFSGEGDNPFNNSDWTSGRPSKRRCQKGTWSLLLPHWADKNELLNWGQAHRPNPHTEMLPGGRAGERSFVTPGEAEVSELSLF